MKDISNAFVSDKAPSTPFEPTQAKKRRGRPKGATSGLARLDSEYWYHVGGKVAARASKALAEKRDRDQQWKEAARWHRHKFKPSTIKPLRRIISEVSAETRRWGRFMSLRQVERAYNDFCAMFPANAPHPPADMDDQLKHSLIARFKKRIRKT